MGTPFGQGMESGADRPAPANGLPDDETMRVSYEAIYQAVHVQGGEALRPELTACLRTGRVMRTLRARTRVWGKSFISPELMISERPSEVAGRAILGHRKGDLIMGPESLAIGTLVERTTRLTILLHLPRMTDHGQKPRTKIRAALAGHGAEPVRDAIKQPMIDLPELTVTDLGSKRRDDAAWRSADRDRTQRLLLRYPQPVAARDEPETNRLLRQYISKRTDLSVHRAGDLLAVTAILNARPRNTLGWRVPAEGFDKFLEDSQSSGIATTT